MLRALYTAATGAITQQFNIDVIANNVSNVNTTGFKKVRTEFQNLLSQNYSVAGGLSSQGTTVPTGVSVGLGTKVSGTQAVFLPGSNVQTGNQTDLAIQGDGFFQVQTDSGAIAYTRDGSFKRDASGQLVTSDGYIVQPGINIPANATQIVIGSNGSVQVQQPGSTALNQVGQIQLARFSNPAGMESIGHNLYSNTAASGDPVTGTPGQGDFATSTITQGYLENSNVQIVEELINLITAQRAFEANSNVIKTSDQVLQKVNNIVS